MKSPYEKVNVEVIANATPVGSWFIETNANGVVAVFTVTSDLEDAIVAHAWAVNTNFEKGEKFRVDRRLFDSYLNTHGKIVKVEKQVALDLIDNLKGNYHDTANQYPLQH